MSSLTAREAQERASLIEVERYDIEVDLTGLPEGPEFAATATIRFRCARPGAATFLDCAAAVRSATLNGRPIPATDIDGERITLADLAAENVVTVTSVQHRTEADAGGHRAVDPADGEVYFWSSFEPDQARAAWACFDQPDLKAPFAFTVTAPARWTVLSNLGPVEVTPAADARRWVFPATPPLSTYVPVVNAGPFHERRASRGGFDLGLYARRSLAAFLDRDAEELFDLTAAGLAFFGERFAMPFPESRYDQVFVQDLGGAMENYGCVTWSDRFVYRSTPSPGQREQRAVVLLHEMAHMWFGDIVTMRWWDDLWLNEAFADWAADWAASRAGGMPDVWATVAVGRKLAGYAADRAPTTHPIRQPIPDVATATARFDMITYAKGAAALKQLVAYLGEDAFLAGLRAYFARYAWGNATLADLVGALSAAAGVDLTEWTRGWLETAGTDTLTIERTDGGCCILATGPDGGPPRPHRIGLGIYHRDDDRLERSRLLTVELAGPETAVADVPADADVLLLNDEDLTFAAVQPDPASLDALLAGAAGLPTATARAVAVATAWGQLVSGRLAATRLVDCTLAVLRREHSDELAERLLALAVEAAELWVGATEAPAAMGAIAATCLEVIEAGDARRLAAVRALARTATSDTELAALRRAAAEDVDLRWRAATRRSALGRLDPAELTELQGRDPDPDVWVRALAVRTAAPDPAAKEAAWLAAVDERSVPIGALYELAGAFWQPSQADLLAPYAERYLEVLPRLSTASMISSMALPRAMFPVVGVPADFPDRIDAAAADPAVMPVVTRTVRERADELRRMLAARG